MGKMAREEGFLGKARIGSAEHGRGRKKRVARIPYRDCFRDGRCRFGGSQESMRDIDYMTPLITQTWDMIDAGAIDMEAARIGHDVATGAVVWSYRSLLNQLMSAGHCYWCAKNFVDSFAQITDKDGVLENVMVATKADQAEEAAAIKRQQNM